MASRETENNNREQAREIERYRQAALEALGQLEWCIDYLHRLRKTDLARALGRNRKKNVERAGF